MESGFDVSKKLDVAGLGRPPHTPKEWLLYGQHLGCPFSMPSIITSISKNEIIKVLKHEGRPEL